MLTPQLALCELAAGQGSPASNIAERRAQLAEPVPGSISPQRLKALAGRLARVRALGGEYARVDFSPELARRLEVVRS
jgi:hypothetical protein